MKKKDHNKRKVMMRATVQLILTNASENQTFKKHILFGTEGIIFSGNRL